MTASEFFANHLNQNRVCYYYFVLATSHRNKNSQTAQQLNLMRKPHIQTGQRKDKGAAAQQK
jgi:hypothetical protein